MKQDGISIKREIISSLLFWFGMFLFVYWAIDYLGNMVDLYIIIGLGIMVLTMILGFYKNNIFNLIARYDK